MALFAVDMYGARLVPGLFRLLTHWPAYLAHVAVELLPLFERPDFVKICHDIVHRIDYVMPIVIDVIVTGSPPSTRKLLTSFAARWASVAGEPARR